MWSTVALVAVLACGQTPADDCVIAPAADSVQIPAADCGLLMQSLQGTYAGSWLDRSRTEVSGWVSGTFTGSTQTNGTLLTGF